MKTQTLKRIREPRTLNDKYYSGNIITSIFFAITIYYELIVYSTGWSVLIAYIWAFCALINENKDYRTRKVLK